MSYCEKLYAKALDVVSSELFGFKLTEDADHESFEVTGQYFTLEYEPVVEGIQLHVHEKTDVIVDCMMEELAEMTCIREKLEHVIDNFEQ